MAVLTLILLLDTRQSRNAHFHEVLVTYVLETLGIPYAGAVQRLMYKGNAGAELDDGLLTEPIAHF